MRLFEFSAFAHPLLPGGGLFLLIVGAAVLIGGLHTRGRTVYLIAGFMVAAVAMGVCAAALSKPFGMPSKVQVSSLVIAILLEVFAIRLVRRRLQGRGEKQMTLAILQMVALHFLIMVPAFGPGVALLGVACSLNAWAAMKRRDYSLQVAWAVDGSLKMSAGVLMLTLPFVL